MTDRTHSGVLMPCPKCEAPMRTLERSGVHLETCPECRGIFLDRGELDRLLDLETASLTRDDRPRGSDTDAVRDRDDAAYRRSYREDDRDLRRYRDDDDDDDRDEHRGSWGRGPDGSSRRSSRRGGFLNDLFENLGG